MINVLLLSYQASTHDPEIGKLGPGHDDGIWWPLDRAYPEWSEEFQTASLLWSDDDKADPAERLTELLSAHPEVDTIVAFGRNVAKLLMPGYAKFFSWYKAGDLTIIPIPNPTPRNRLVNTDSFERQLRSTLILLATNKKEI